MEKFIAVIDYGSGNLRSVAKALEFAGARVKVTADPKVISNAGALLLPGVGAFRRAMENLKNLNLLKPIYNSIEQGKPFLGICLGFQVLFSQSEEHGSSAGLGIIKGNVKKFTPEVKIPHMGWNNIRYADSAVGKHARSSIFKGIPEKTYFYFVHSYYAHPRDNTVTAATTDYGKEFVSVVNKDNVWGIQFHPEKSEKPGLKILENFLKNVS